MYYASGNLDKDGIKAKAFSTGVSVETKFMKAAISKKTQTACILC